MINTKDLRTCLRSIVADFHVLAGKAQECHWNVLGENFGPLHDLFGDLYAFCIAQQDVVAERARALGFLVASGPAASGLTPRVLAREPVKGMLMALLADMRATCRCLCDCMQTADPITANILQDVAGQLDKWAWKVRAHTITKETV